MRYLKALYESSRNTFKILLISLLSITLVSCSLVKIESDQTPLAKVDLNTRILTQAFAKEAMERVEYAADSIVELASGNVDVQINSLQWKIKSSRELGRLSFQTEPKIALLDTWSYFLEVRQAINSDELEGFFGDYKHIAAEAIEENITEIESIASSVLNKKEFEDTKAFVQDYARTTPIMSQQKFRHKTIRPAYLDYKQIPDSLAYQTVGTLSEVVADASNRIGYITDASSKRLSWRTEMLLKEKGIDSLKIQAKLDEIDRQFERFLTIAENTPEEVDNAIKEFRNNISPLFTSLNRTINSSFNSLSNDIGKVDTILLRERIALDSLIQREREELYLKTDELVETGIEKAFDSLTDMIKSILIYVIIFLIVLLGIPFYLGYILGKKKSK